MPVTARQPLAPRHAWLPFGAVILPIISGCPSPSGGGAEPPSVEILFPQEQQTITGGNVELCARVTDPDHSLSSLTVEARVDGSAIYEKTPGDETELPSTWCTAAGQNGNLGLSLGALSPGGHILEVFVGDPTGGESLARVPFNVDGSQAVTPSPDLGPDPSDIPPECAMRAPANGAIFGPDDAVIFEVEVSDTEDDPSELLVFWSSEPTTEAIDGQGGYASFASATRFTAVDLAPGAYAVEARVVDTAGVEVACEVAITVLACDDADGDGYLPCGEGPSDCDDTSAQTYPGASDQAGGGDNDCDGRIDEDAPDAPTDLDGDGYPEGDGDCDDTDSATFPGAVESGDGKDNDCDGTVDERTWLYDDDGDGHSEADGDCDDTSATTYPGAAEGAGAKELIIADGVDNDCDGKVDEGTTATDDDGDGYSEDQGDCDDGDSSVAPGAFDEPTGGIDDDCDGRVDEGVVDDDNDGYAALGGAGPYDCDDGDAAVHPQAQESCDGGDDDCDGVVDEELADDDGDGDGFGACATSPQGGDCDDGDASLHPGAAEGGGSPDYPEGDGLDNDCDGTTDEGTDLFDDDGDGWSEAEGDCNDGEAAIAPGGDDSEGGGDEDCDGLIDEDAVDAGDVLITEVRRATYQETGTDLQWFEIFNTTGRDISLAGWQITATEGHPDFGATIDRETTLGPDAPVLAPGSYAVLGATDDTGANGGVLLDGTYDTLFLGLGGVLTLSLGDALIVDTVDWDDGILYPIEEGASLNLSRSALDEASPHLLNDQPASWCIPGSFYGRDLRGTPGAENDGC